MMKMQFVSLSYCRDSYQYHSNFFPPGRAQVAGCTVRKGLGMTPLDACAELSAVTTTVASAEAAQRLVQAVLEQRLAACVQVEAVVSHYRWRGVLQHECEHRLVCKTLPTAVPRLLDLLRALHPYDLPELVVQPLHATAEYADLVRQELAPQAL